MIADYDVAIFGGGPAGALTACLLAKQCPELRVCILEKASFPRHHIGESTLPGWSSVLERAGVLELIDQHTVIKKGGVVFNWGPEEAGETWTVDFRDQKTKRPPPGSWFLNRSVVDTIILEHAEHLGCAVFQGTGVERVVAEIQEDEWTAQETPEYFTIHTSSMEPITAKWVVDATGQSRVLSRLWKLPLYKHEDLNNFALYGYWRTPHFFKPDWELCESERWGLFSTSDEGWVWFVPIDHETVSVGLVTDKETLSNTPADQISDRYFQSTESAGKIKSLLDGGEYLGDRPDGSRPGRVSAIQDWSYRNLRSCGPGWFIVGDSAMFVDPVLSSGLFLAARGASMVANAITTLVQRETDVSLLCDSYQQTYQELADAYVRMAKVWHQRNTRADSWHWQARRERLRAGAPSLYERDQDAFTALALGALGSPLDAAVSGSRQETWGSEFFIWFTASRLFSDVTASGEGPEGSVADGHSASAPTDPEKARDSSRREVAARWRALLYSRLQVQEVSWENKERYHSNESLQHWERVQFLEVQPKGDDWNETPIIFPCFPDLPSGILPYLDGTTSTLDIIQHQLRHHDLASEGRGMRVKMIADMLLRLQMMGLLRNVGEQPPPPGSDHALFQVIIPSVLQSLDVECQVLFELDWLGECCTIRFLKDGQRGWMKCFDKRDIDASMLGTVSASSALRWGKFEADWFQRFMAAVRPRLDAREERFQNEQGRSHWEGNRGQAGLGLFFDFKPDAPVTARLF